MYFNRLQKLASLTSRRGRRLMHHEVRLRLELLEDRRLLSGTPERHACGVRRSAVGV